MDRYILRYTGGAVPPAADLDAITARSGVTVLDRAPKMLKVEAAEPTIKALVAELPGWVSSPEYKFPVPDTRKKVARPPED